MLLGLKFWVDKGLIKERKIWNKGDICELSLQSEPLNASAGFLLERKKLKLKLQDLLFKFSFTHQLTGYDRY